MGGRKEIPSLSVEAFADSLSFILLLPAREKQLLVIDFDYQRNFRPINK